MRDFSKEHPVQITAEVVRTDRDGQPVKPVVKLRIGTGDFNFYWLSESAVRDLIDALTRCYKQFPGF